MISLQVIIAILILGNDSVTKSQSFDGYGYEQIHTKLDLLEFRFTQLFVQLKEQAEGFSINQQRVENAQKQLNRIIERNEQMITQLVEGTESFFVRNISLINDYSRRIFELQTVCSNHDLIRNSLFELRPNNTGFRSPVRSTDGILMCSEKTSGSCLMKIKDENVPVYLEQKRFGGNWLIVLQRMDGSENFNRNWTNYRNGFGTVGQEFWLGLERLHQLTKESSHELLVELEDFDGNYRYARYDKFAVGPEDKFYPLTEVGTYSGTAGDSFNDHKGSKFSTMDNGSRKNCQFQHSGGWWYGVNGACYETHLTGRWEKINYWTSIVWKKFGDPHNLGLKFARMMIRRINSA